jgi:hypothetical protein
MSACTAKIIRPGVKLCVKFNPEYRGIPHQRSRIVTSELTAKKMDYLTWARNVIKVGLFFYALKKHKTGDQ